MNPEEMQSQDPTQGLTPDELAASLAFASHQQSQFIPQDEQEQPEQPVEEPEQAQEPNADLEGIKTEFTSFQEEIRQTIKDEVGGIRKLIEEAIKDDETDETAE